MTLSDTDLGHLRACVALAREALDAGDEPFGSVLVDATGAVRFTDRNRVKDGDETRHPEFEIARWSAAHLSPEERATATVYTSGEHCPMCSAAHAWMGLGRIVYAVSSAQLSGWLADGACPRAGCSRSPSTSRARRPRRRPGARARAGDARASPAPLRPGTLWLTRAMARPLTLITGGTRGIGAATALRLAADGHDLVLGYATDAAAAETCRAAVEDVGVRCTVLAGDVADPAQVERLFTEAAREGQLTGVVNNAGATLHSGTLAETDPAVIQRTVDLNLSGALYVARAAVRALGRSYGGGGGVLVNISSAAATLGSPGEYVQYAAAKAGVDALTTGLAQEVARDDVRVVGVAPGMVRTRIHEDAGDPDRLERLADSVPVGRPGEASEIAEAVAWLISDSASYVTGTTLRVAGGR